MARNEVVNEKELHLWPLVKIPHYYPTRLVVANRSDLIYLAKELGFSENDLEQDGISRNDTHFITYKGIDPYKKWEELLDAE